MNRRETVVIGGGVIGCSIAYHLLKKGMQVTVMERDRVGAHASSAAAGMLGAQVEMAFPGPMVELCLASRAMFPALQQELLQWTGMDIELDTSGLLRVAWEEEEAGRLRERARWQREWGEKADWWDHTRLRKEEPSVSKDTTGALYLPMDAQVSAPRLTRALAQAVRILGGELLEGTEVTGFVTEGNRLTGVETSRGTYLVEHVVLAAGAWSGILAERAGISLPVSPVKGESLSLKPKGLPHRKTLFGEGCYLVPKADGQVIVGATEKKGDMTPGVAAESLHRLLREAVRLVPELAEGEFVRCWSGLRPGSADGLPYLGRTGTHPNLYIASGHFRNGILLSPATGKWMAELITGKDVPQLHPFSPDRHTTVRFG